MTVTSVCSIIQSATYKSWSLNGLSPLSLCHQLGQPLITMLHRWRHHVIEKPFTFLTLCEGNPPVTGGFPSQRASNAELWYLLLWPWCIQWSSLYPAVVYRPPVDWEQITFWMDSQVTYHQFSDIRLHPIPKHKRFPSRLAVVFAQSTEATCWEWRCNWSSADRRCSNYIWVINKFIAY